ncbi:MAG: hypothetical protein O2973_08950 [Gemmatimonadetes bacterium]|nr:hypothetical protein [Gemmatimonadota bacterium]
MTAPAMIVDTTDFFMRVTSAKVVLGSLSLQTMAFPVPGDRDSAHIEPILL